jgi:hypothetical protein
VTRDNRLQAEIDLERENLTAWAAANPPTGIEPDWHPATASHEDGVWVGLRHPNYPITHFAIYFERDGVASRLLVEPVRSGNITGTGAQLTRRFVRDIPFGELEQAALPIAIRRLAEEAHDAAAVVTFTDASGNTVGQSPLVDDGGPDTEVARAAARRHALLAQSKGDGGARRKGGRPALHPDEFYALMAYRYVQALQFGRDPIRAVARDADCSMSQARNHISVARRKELLTATLPGRAGGQLTGKAGELLEKGNQK